MKKQKTNKLTLGELAQVFQEMTNNFDNSTIPIVVDEAVIQRELWLNRIVFTIIGCGLTLLGIGIGLWMGVL